MLGPAPLRGRLARRDGPLQARGRTAGPVADRGEERSRGLRAHEGKRPCQIVTLLASANPPVCARAGRQAEFLRASVAAA